MRTFLEMGSRMRSQGITKDHRVVLFHHDLLPLKDLIPLGDAKEIKAGGESLPIDPQVSAPFPERAAQDLPALHAVEA
jgi:hypothetical protein